MVDPELARATIDRYVAAWTGGDRDGWVGCFATDATVEDPVGSPLRKGHAEIGEFFDQLRSMADSRLVLDREPVIVGDEAVLVLHAELGTEGEAMRLDVVDHFTFGDDGLLTAQRAFWDPTTIRPA